MPPPPKKSPSGIEENIPRKNAPAARSLVFLPAKGPCPVVVFSPAAAAGSTGGYKALAKELNDAGFALVEVAFKNDDPAERGAQFSDVVDWLEKKKFAVDLDLKRVYAGGHSRGGWAAVVAARRDKRFAGCVVLNPSGPEKAEGDHAVPIVAISGDDPGDAKTADALFEQFDKKGERVTIKGLKHELQPAPAASDAFAAAVQALRSL